MRARAFFDDAAKAQAAQEVKAIEARTAAEVVVAVRHASGQYRHTDYLVGFGLSLVTLVALLYLPPEFPLETFPVDVALSFVLGAGVSALLPGVRRRLDDRLSDCTYGDFRAGQQVKNAAVEMFHQRADAGLFAQLPRAERGPHGGASLPEPV
ncbi:MAG: hypothetical protein ACXU86_25305, partial [Archangium sp.]